ncbi:hypothetical protein LCGC14_2465000, partial [marine sediment metagenome]
LNYSMVNRSLTMGQPDRPLNQSTISTLKAFRGGQAAGEFLPSYYGIEVTRHCNFACTMCPHRHYKRNEKGHMDWSLFRSVVDQVADSAEIIKLHWVGEPLLHPRIAEMIRYARDRSSARLHLSTNASLLTRELAEDIRTAGLDRITFSLDSANASTYNTIRINGDYDTVVGNVEHFVEAVESKGGPLCEVKLIQMTRNSDQIESFRRKWSTYETVAVNIMWLSDWAGNVRGFEDESPYINPVSRRSRTPCSDLWFKMQVNWMGQIALCCFDAFGSHILGDFRTDSLAEIWHSQTVRELRKQHLQHRFPAPCASCRDWAQPQEYEFWYTDEQYKTDPGLIWLADPLTDH